MPYLILLTSLAFEHDQLKSYQINKMHKDQLKYNIMQAIVSFCKKSNMMTVAEGIEEEIELEVVSEIGVDAIQGYLLARPAPEISPEIFTTKFGD